MSTTKSIIPTTSVTGYHEKDTAKCTTADLQGYGPLTYEVWMIRAIAERTTELSASGKLDTLTENMLVETFAIHFRNLVGFLWPPAPHSKDVYATHFAQSHPSQWTGPTVPKPTELVNRASREVAHLTTYRLSGKPSIKDWDFADCIERLLPALEEFVQRADPAKVPTKLEQEVRALKGVATNGLAMQTLHGTKLSTTADSLIKRVLP